MRWLNLVFAVVVLSTTTRMGYSQQPVGTEAALTNADVVKLMKLGLGDDVVIAKINQAVEVNFDLSPDGLTKLMSDGVSKETMAVMLRRATPPSQQFQPTVRGAPNFRSFAPEVRMRSKDGEVALVGRHGTASYTYAFIKSLIYNNYPGLASKVLISDPKPALLARLKDDPKDVQGGNLALLVKLEQNKGDNKRSLKMVSYSVFGGNAGIGAPDPDWTLPFDASQESPGVWRIVPKTDLKPGEYGLYISSVATLFDFAIDQ